MERQRDVRRGIRVRGQSAKAFAGPLDHVRIASIPILDLLRSLFEDVLMRAPAVASLRLIHTLYIWTLCTIVHTEVRPACMLLLTGLIMRFDPPTRKRPIMRALASVQTRRWSILGYCPRDPTQRHAYAPRAGDRPRTRNG